MKFIPCQPIAVKRPDASLLQTFAAMKEIPNDPKSNFGRTTLQIDGYTQTFQCEQIPDFDNKNYLRCGIIGNNAFILDEIPSHLNIAEVRVGHLNQSADLFVNGQTISKDNLIDVAVKFADGSLYLFIGSSDTTTCPVSKNDRITGISDCWGGDSAWAK